MVSWEQLILSSCFMAFGMSKAKWENARVSPFRAIR